MTATINQTQEVKMNRAHKAWATRRAMAAAKTAETLCKAQGVVLTAAANAANKTKAAKASEAAKKAWETRRAKAGKNCNTTCSKGKCKTTQCSSKKNNAPVELPFTSMVELYTAAWEGAINAPSLAAAVHMIYDDHIDREDAFETLSAVITEYFGIPENLIENHCSDWQIVEAVNNPVNPLWVGQFSETLPEIVDYIRICRLSGV